MGINGNSDCGAESPNQEVQAVWRVRLALLPSRDYSIVTINILYRYLNVKANLAKSSAMQAPTRLQATDLRSGSEQRHAIEAKAPEGATCCSPARERWERENKELSPSGAAPGDAGKVGIFKV
jgi:hypothetical protein